MALRSGYYGLKNATVKAVQKLITDTAGAKIIKTIGNGLKLTSAGTLSCDIDSDTMEFKTGKLAAKKTGGFDFSTDEVNTGQKWIDGKNIYCKVLPSQSISVPGGASWGEVDLTSWNIDTPVFCYSINTENGFVYPMVSDSSANQYGVKFTSTAYGLRKPSSGGATTQVMRIIFFYTKSASESE